MAAIDVEDILSKLTNAEKISLLSGIDFWHTKALPEHGVPSLRLSDGPNGVRGTRFFNGIPAACFPCGTALGATWDSKLLNEAGIRMGEESIAKGAHVLLGPTINMQRSPLGGRGFESLSEDPVLAGLGAANLVSGIQKTGVVATIKHFVCNDMEHLRNVYDVQVTQRAMREIYLLPFQIAVRDSKPGSFMTAYNKVNGTHVSENPELVKKILREEWGWKGLIMSDWFGTYSTGPAINAGLDLEMPGPSRWRGQLLNVALSSNTTTQYAIDCRAREVLDLVNRCAASGIPEGAKEGTRDTPETAQFLRKLAGDSIVLMKNDGGILPLKKDKKTLVIGPNAKIATYCGGGSASLLAYYAVTPYDGISKKVESADLSYTVGCDTHKELPLLGPRLRTKEGKPGVTFKAYNSPPSTTGREAVDELILTKTEMFLVDYKCEKITSNLFYADIEGYLTAETDGEFELGICVYGSAKLYVDGKMVIDNETKQIQGSAFFGTATVEEKGVISVKKGTTYHIKVEFASAPSSKLTTGLLIGGGGGLRLGGSQVIDAEQEIAHAAAMAKDAEQVIICAGTNSDWEGEGADRDNMSLPGKMDALITAVAAANARTVVVMQSGTPVAMPWISSTPGLIQAWFGGNETGNAIADVLFGDVNPSGKLPLTFPVRVQDNPAFLNYRTERGRVLYGEDVYIGYRYYEMAEKEVLFPFGHGLSYTSFEFSNLSVSKDKDDGTVMVKVAVKNTGKVAGAQVVQVYVAPQNPSIRRPKKELKGFAKVFLEAGQEKIGEVKIAVKYAASFWDEERASWIVEKDTYKVFVADTSAAGKEQSLEGSFNVNKTWWWNGL